MNANEVFTAYQLEVIDNLINEALKERENVVSVLDDDCFTGWEWLESFTGKKRKWLTENILSVPALKNRIDEASGKPNSWVKYPTGGRSGYKFHKKRAKAWLEKNRWWK